MKKHDELIRSLERKLSRTEMQIRVMGEDHDRNSQILNYHAGFSLGYLKGKRVQLEERIEDIKELLK